MRQRNVSGLHVLKDSKTTTNLTAIVDTPFASVILTSLDGQPIFSSERLLLATTATCVHSGFEWNEDRKTVKQWGTFPTLIEPVRGQLMLRGLERVATVRYQPLTAEGSPLGDPRLAERTDDGARLNLGSPATTWYILTVER